MEWHHIFSLVFIKLARFLICNFCNAAVDLTEPEHRDRMLISNQHPLMIKFEGVAEALRSSLAKSHEFYFEVDCRLEQNRYWTSRYHICLFNYSEIF